MRWALLVLLAGCGDVPGPDLDGDGITDDDDPCQSGFADHAVDADGDGKDATVDLCPHDANAAAGDQDRDGIPDACDPFFDEAKPDTRRCVTAFGVRWLNASYLEARVGEQAWDLAPPLSASALENVSIVSTIRLAYPSVSYDLLGTARFATADEAASVKLWLRAQDEPSDKDIACGVDGAGHLFVFAANTRQAIVALPAPIDGPFRLRATVGGPRATVLCRATIGTQTIATTLEATLSPGTYGIAAANTDVVIESLVIDTNDSPVAFRNYSE